MNRSTQPLLPSWDHNQSGEARLVETSWTKVLRSGREALWPYLADTSSLNERLGLPEMEFEERDGHLFGSSGKGLTRHEWVEVPWAWESGRSLVAERRYSRGFATAVCVRYLLDDDAGSTRLTVYVGWAPRSWWSRPILSHINRWLRVRYDRVLEEIDELASSEVTATVRPPVLKIFNVNEDRLKAGIRELAENGFTENEAGRLANYIRTASDQALFRLQPKKLAFEWRMDLQDLLALLLQATRAGWLRLSWDVMCPHCQGIRKESRSLGDLREFGHCEVCDIEFTATDLASIEVTFRVQPEIREVREIFYCSAEPAKKPHILVQHHLSGQETCEFELALTPGRYRLRRALGSQDAVSFQVDGSEGADSFEWKITSEASSGVPVSLGSKVRITVVNPEAENVSIVVEKVATDPIALRPSELFNLQRFRDLFSEESIATGLKLEIGHQTLLFTDIVGSTRLYQELGDSGAFNAVHAHFVELQKIVGAHKGAVVKTIGDAMMAAFQSPEDALEAAVEIQKKFTIDAPQKLMLRASIHRGICLAVRFESNIDYFGNAVNFAAKIQSVAGGGEIVFSREFYAGTGIADSARTLGLQVKEIPFALLPGDADGHDTVLLASME